MGRPRLWSAALGMAVAAFVVLGAFLLMMVSAASHQLNSLRTEQASQAKVISDLSAGLSTANQQLQQHGIKPIAPPPQQIIEQGAVGPQGPGPSDAQVVAAVTIYLQAHPLPSAPPPSIQQIADAVAGYLKANPVISGKDGAPGPGPSDAQVSAAVASYVAAHPPADGATGPAGPAGPSGALGASGAQGADGKTGATGPAGKDGEPGPAGPACPTGYSPTPETVNGHQAVVCEQSSTPTPTSSPPTSPTGPVLPSPAGVAVPLLFGWLTIPRDQRRR